MAHHSHSHSDHTHTHGATGNIRLAFFINLFFAVIELIGGLWTNSVAILSDALHDFGDSISLGVAWYLQKFSSKGRDKKYSYGYKRFSLLGAVFISVVLLVGSVIVIREAVERIMNPESPHAQGMFLLAIFGIAVNGFAAYRLTKGKSLSERAVSLHMLEDVLGWVAVLIVSVVMMFVDLPILDPLLSVGISLWVLYNVFRNLNATFKVLLQHVPQDIDTDQLIEQISNLEGVTGVHDFHLWSLDGEENIMTLHVVISENKDLQYCHQLKVKIRDILHRNQIHHATIEFEYPGEKCDLSDC